jgi:hypothetical protein
VSLEKRYSSIKPISSPGGLRNTINALQPGGKYSLTKTFPVSLNDFFKNKYQKNMIKGNDMKPIQTFVDLKFFRSLKTSQIVFPNKFSEIKVIHTRSKERILYVPNICKKPAFTC